MSFMRFFHLFLSFLFFFHPFEFDILHRGWNIFNFYFLISIILLFFHPFGLDFSHRGGISSISIFWFQWFFSFSTPLDLIFHIGVEYQTRFAHPDITWHTAIEHFYVIVIREHFLQHKTSYIGANLYDFSKVNMINNQNLL